MTTSTPTPDDPEIWRDVPGWPLYQVSTHGRLRSFHRGKLCTLTGGRDRDGYRRAVLCTGTGEKKSIRLHHMVLWAFHGPCPEGLVGRHLDGDLSNNRPDNLAWSTQRDNIRDKIDHGTMPRGEVHPNAKLTADTVLAIRASQEPRRALAHRYNVSPSTIDGVTSRRNWAWL